MRKIVKLSFLADQLEEAMEGWSQFYNVETGEVESLPDQDNVYVDFKEFEEIAEKIDASYVYVRLPTQFDIHEYRIMEAFAEKLRGMGYEEVRLIDTTDGTFLGKKEAAWLDLAGSTLLVGRK